MPSPLPFVSEALPATPREQRRCRLELRGRVQGVGFRPHAWRLAKSLGLEGEVGNHAQGAWVVVQGPAAAVQAFIERLGPELPLPGLLRSQQVEELLPQTAGGAFIILPSLARGELSAELSPDLDVCPDCLRELFDPSDRRHGYPFLNCTRCGPRYSVVRALPYDRSHTTLAGFPLCPRCRAEYENPADRRFHAQPIACPDCGPRLWAAEPSGAELPGDPFALAVETLEGGGTLALKGLGGFHLACRADSERSVLSLRERKGREAKPFAAMVHGIEEARRLARLDPAAEAALLSPAKPIVLAPKKPGRGLAEALAPGAPRWGLLLPYTPLHHVLMSSLAFPIVMTSANPSGEPLCHDNAEALLRLRGLADLFLMHDRPIARPLDDSVVLALEGEGAAAAEVLPLRRARGYAPAPLALPFAATETVLALGGELKSSVCLLRGEQAWLSEHLGELDQPAAFRHFLAAAERLEQLFDARPARLAADLHPLYAATRWAQAQPLPLTLVQHHHAHVASVMAEHGLQGKLLGLACDGTGYGSDGSIWGGELLLADYQGFERVGHLRPFALPGGDAAAREPWRAALGALEQLPAAERARGLEALRPLAGEEALALAARRLQAGGGTTACSSLGRLFDAAAALLGLCGVNRYEAEAASRLQACAESAAEAPALPWDLQAPGAEGGAWVLDWRPLLAALLKGGDRARLARGFHEGLAEMLAAGAARAAAAAKLDRVALGGGCFANALLSRLTAARLRARGLQVFFNRQVPCGDGGLALGQAAVAAAGGGHSHRS